MFSRYVAHVFFNKFEIAPVVPIITGITFVFTFDMRCISIVRFSYFRPYNRIIIINIIICNTEREYLDDDTHR